MKRALFVASVGILASTVWAAAANAQANINPNVYPGNTSGPYGPQAPFEWYASPGPKKRGNMCVKDVDATRGYGIHEPCPAPAASASGSARAAAPTAAASPSTRALSARASAAPRAAAPTRKQKVVKHSQ